MRCNGPDFERGFRLLQVPVLRPEHRGHVPAGAALASIHGVYRPLPSGLRGRARNMGRGDAAHQGGGSTFVISHPHPAVRVERDEENRRVRYLSLIHI